MIEYKKIVLICVLGMAGGR